MNARKAKKIRQLVYEKGHHPGVVMYKWVGQKIVADQYRRIYQDTKKVNRG